MKHLCSLLVLVYLANGLLYAQNFITRGNIEFEIRRNTKKMFGNNQNSNFTPPDEDIAYRNLIFSGDRSVYVPGKSASTATMFPNDAQLYTNLAKQQLVIKKKIFDEAYVYEDSLKKVKWKIGDETRVIAGLECRKAIGVINDTVYVVAFYCPEIIPQGGPELFSGLPGMILGLAIPRYFTTWFATKIELANIDESVIVPPSAGKRKQFKLNELVALLYLRYKKDGWWKDVTPEKVLQTISSFTLR